MGASYRQFCPVSKAMELLDERWTMLVVRELLLGSERFNDLRRGLPAMSPTLLSKRLAQLVRAGVVRRQADGSDVRYVLTPAGRELEPVVTAVGIWGTRWVGQLGDADLDPRLLLWDMHRHVDFGQVPDGRTVVQFTFQDKRGKDRDWWLVITDAGTDVCDLDPGYDVSVLLISNLRTMVDVWRGDLTWSTALRSGALDVQGPAPLRRAVPQWFTPSNFAAVPRPALRNAVATP
ncbi:MAG: transcriptional regulator [Actinomycetota bacterium]|nr:MAG: transcriptional regulator [Actinomycetota bacterium]